MCLPWRLAAQRIRRWRRRHPTHSTPREILTDPRRCSIIGDHRPLYRLSTVTVETLGAHHTLTEEESTAGEQRGNLGGGRPGFRTHLLHYREIIPPGETRAIPSATLNYTLTWRMRNEAESSLFRLSFGGAGGPAEPERSGERRTTWPILWRISRELDGNAGRIRPTIAMERPYVRRSAHYTPLALLYYKVVSEWETKPRPLPAQPYILVLWATHIGRYAIKHSPSARARERASRAERL